MQYDPIKRSVGNLFNKSPFLRKLFYHLLDLLLLRAWHVHKELSALPTVSTLKDTETSLTILDAGAGFGQYSYWMFRHFKKCSILAVDVKEEQVADCNRFFSSIGASNVKFEVADLTKFVNEHTYDLILSVDVMEHILEDVQVFRNFHASMKKGGMLLISTPSDQGGSDVQGDNDSSFIEEHVRDGYNIKEIEDKLHSAGFSKVETRYSYGNPGKISWRLSMKYPIQALGVSKLFFIILPFYYLIAYPVSFVLNYFDTSGQHQTGTGLIVKAWK
jgi:2-polyprenyl-3-methyl-5-hydroxy-6-metoxy-1,4-benzoquinol methylase